MISTLDSLLGILFLPNSLRSFTVIFVFFFSLFEIYSSVFSFFLTLCVCFFVSRKSARSPPLECSSLMKRRSYSFPYSPEPDASRSVSYVCFMCSAVFFLVASSFSPVFDRGFLFCCGQHFLPGGDVVCSFNKVYSAYE